MKTTRLGENIFLQDEVDIFQYPEFDTSFNTKTIKQITIGDLHGNLMKFLYLLVRHGILALTKQDYQKLSELYRVSPKEIQASDLEYMHTTVMQAQAHQGVLIRLLGDEVADRGGNDIYILWLLKKLKQEGIKVELILSNHSAEFIKTYEHDLIAHPLSSRNYCYKTLLTGLDQDRSLQGLGQLILRKLINPDQVIELIESVYLPCSLLLSVSTHQNNELTVYSHARIDPRVIANICQHSGFESLHCDIHNAKSIAHTIHEVNHRYQNVLAFKQLSNVLARYEDFSFDAQNNPLHMLLWNRYPEYCNNTDPSITWVHGHDSSDATQGNIVNLDNRLGKRDHLNQGEYTVLIEVNNPSSHNNQN